MTDHSDLRTVNFLCISLTRGLYRTMVRIVRNRPFSSARPNARPNRPFSPCRTPEKVRRDVGAVLGTPTVFVVGRRFRAEIENLTAPGGYA